METTNVVQVWDEKA
jgi:hypothetical protein